MSIAHATRQAREWQSRARCWGGQLSRCRAAGTGHRVRQRRPRSAPCKDDVNRPRAGRRHAAAGRRLHRRSPRRADAPGHQAAAPRSVHHPGFLRGPRAVERSALLPLQQPARHRNPLGRRGRRGDRQGSACLRALGSLRPRLPAQIHRQPLPLPYCAGALRGAARGNPQARRTDRAHTRHAAERMERHLSPASLQSAQ